MNFYAPYYLNQVGTGLPGFQGIRFQRGHGFFGRIFSNTLLPFFKQLLPAVGKRVLPSAMDLAQDIMSGANVKQSALNRLGEAGKNVADETLDQIKSRIQKGSGRKRKRRVIKRVKPIKRKKIKRRKVNKKKKKLSNIDFLE